MKLFVDIKKSFSELPKIFKEEKFNEYNEFKNYFIENKKELRKFFI